MTDGESKYDFIQILELQMIAETFKDELLGRYLSNPGNLDKMRKISRTAMASLKQLESTDDRRCPDGYHHGLTCRCVLDEGPKGNP